MSHTQTDTPDPALLLAQEIADESGFHGWVRSIALAAALSAIRETTELAYQQCLKMDGPLNNSGACAMALRANRHLKKGSTDDQL